jgi:hypothetical protein
MLCPVELSNAAFITSAALLLGIPHPHARYLRDQTRDYANFDVFGDCLLNNPTHAAHSRTQSHDHIISILADLASRQGIPTSTKHVPFADSQTQRRADLVTCRGGLVRQNPSLNFGPATLLVMDFELGHTYNSSHVFKPNNLASMENRKRSKYLSAYHDQGLAFAPLVCNSLGQLGPDFQRFLWALADHVACNQIASELSLNEDTLPLNQTAAKDLRGLLYQQASCKILGAIFEGVTERIYGRTFALRSMPAYLRRVAETSQPWLPQTPSDRIQVPLTAPASLPALLLDSESPPETHSLRVASHLPSPATGARSFRSDSFAAVLTTRFTAV